MLWFLLVRRPIYDSPLLSGPADVRGLVLHEEYHPVLTFSLMHWKPFTYSVLAVGLLIVPSRRLPLCPGFRCARLMECGMGVDRQLLLLGVLPDG